MSHPKSGSPSLAIPLAAALVTAFGWGCEADGGPRPGRSTAEVMRTDSAGIGIVTTPLAAIPEAETGPPLLALGAPAGAPEGELHRVREPFLHGDGLVVPNAGTAEIRIFNRDGSLRRSAGREGDGPGEYRSIEWARPYRGDSIAVWDARLERLTILGPTLELGRLVRPAGRDDGPAVGRGLVRSSSTTTSRTLVVGTLADGDFLARVGEASVGPADTTAVRRDPIPYLRLDPEGRVLDTLAVLPDDELFVWSDGPSRSIQPLPFGRTTDVVATGRWLAAATNDGFQIHLGDATDAPDAPGSTRIARVDLPRAPVTDDDVAGHRERALAALEHLSAAFRDSRVKALEAIPYPDHAPYHGELIETGGALWLAEYGKPEGRELRRWFRIDAESGVAELSVTLAPSARLTDARGDTLVVVRRNELDVEEVVLLPVRVSARR